MDDATYNHRTIAVRIFGDDRPALPPLPPVEVEKTVVSDDAGTGDLIYCILLDQTSKTFEALFATLANATRAIVVSLSGVLHPLLQDRASDLNGTFLCPISSDCYAPLAHLVSTAGLIGLDTSDTLEVMRGKVGRIWNGSIDDVAETLQHEAPASASVAFSNKVAFEVLARHVDTLQRKDVTCHAGGALSDPAAAQMLLMTTPKPRIDRSAELLSSASYGRYCQYARVRGYSDPFVPYVGDRYGEDGFPRIVYCGASARWDAYSADFRDYDELRRTTSRWYNDYVLGGGGQSPFWRLFHAIMAAADPEPDRPRIDRMRHAAWTNLSKLGAHGTSAPLNSDEELRAMDVAQMRHEIAALGPDVLVCVSGSMVNSTGHALFESLVSSANLFESENTASAPWIRALNQGGKLYWTMHPQRKSSAWFDTTVDDVRRLIFD